MFCSSRFVRFVFAILNIKTTLNELHIRWRRMQNRTRSYLNNSVFPSVPFCSCLCHIIVFFFIFRANILSTVRIFCFCVGYRYYEKSHFLWFYSSDYCSSRYPAVFRHGHRLLTTGETVFKDWPSALQIYAYSCRLLGSRRQRDGVIRIWNVKSDMYIRFILWLLTRKRHIIRVIFLMIFTISTFSNNNSIFASGFPFWLSSVVRRPHILWGFCFSLDVYNHIPNCPFHLDYLSADEEWVTMAWLGRQFLFVSLSLSFVLVCVRGATPLVQSAAWQRRGCRLSACFHACGTASIAKLSAIFLGLPVYSSAFESVAECCVSGGDLMLSVSRRFLLDPSRIFVVTKKCVLSAWCGTRLL